MYSKLELGYLIEQAYLIFFLTYQLYLRTGNAVHEINKASASAKSILDKVLNKKSSSTLPMS